MTATEDAVQEEAATDPVREAIAQSFADELGDGFIAQHINPGSDLWIRIAASSWVDAARFARDKLGRNWIDFISAIDWMPNPYGREMEAEQDWVVHGGGPNDKDESDAEKMTTGVTGGDTRFQMFMRLYSTEEHIGVTIKADVPDEAPAIETLIPVFVGASWHEREVWEMFGIDIIGHPDKRVLYLPTGFEGNPMRKDFPLVARRVKPWPGIVDVEAMPGDGDGDGDSAADAATDAEDAS